MAIANTQNKSHKTKWQLHFEMSLAKMGAIFQKVIDNILVFKGDVFVEKVMSEFSSVKHHATFHHHRDGATNHPWKKAPSKFQLLSKATKKGLMEAA